MSEAQVLEHLTQLGLPGVLAWGFWSLGRAMARISPVIDAVHEAAKVIIEDGKRRK